MSIRHGIQQLQQRSAGALYIKSQCVADLNPQQCSKLIGTRVPLIGTASYTVSSDILQRITVVDQLMNKVVIGADHNRDSVNSKTF